MTIVFLDFSRIEEETISEQMTITSRTVTKSIGSRKYDVSISQTMKTDPAFLEELNNRTDKAHAAQGE